MMPPRLSMKSWFFGTAHADAMIKRCLAALAPMFLAALAVAGAAAPAEPLRQMLSRAESNLDFAEAKLAIDKMVDPAIDVEIARAELDQLAAAAATLAGPLATATQKVAAVRKVIYEPGLWNGKRVFAYDHDDPLGKSVNNKLLPTYLKTRRGNCVTMPALFVILADRLGVDVTLSTAPLHLFVKYRDEAGRWINLETTSGANPARDAWIRQVGAISDEQVARGAYMATLTRREAVSHLATTIIDKRLEEGRYQDVIDAADAILESYPKDVYTMVKAGSAYYHLLRTRFYERYPTRDDIPPEKFTEHNFLAQKNDEYFKRAEALGWTPPSDPGE